MACGSPKIQLSRKQREHRKFQTFCLEKLRSFLRSYAGQKLQLPSWITANNLLLSVHKAKVSLVPFTLLRLIDMYVTPAAWDVDVVELKLVAMLWAFSSRWPPLTVSSVGMFTRAMHGVPASGSGAHLPNVVFSTCS